MSVFWINVILFAIIAYLVVVPPSYDPAIRLKEWNEKIREKLK
jgi:hypothetical protein